MLKLFTYKFYQVKMWKRYLNFLEQPKELNELSIMIFGKALKQAFGNERAWCAIPNDETFSKYTRNFYHVNDWIRRSPKIQMNEVAIAKPKSKNMYEVMQTKPSRVQMIEKYGDLTLKKIIKQQPPSIRALEREYGRKTIHTALCVMVGDLNQSFNGDMNEDDLEEVAAELRMGITKSLSLEDLYLICRNIKTSTKSYKLRVTTILKAANDYLQEKSNLVMNENYNKHRSMQFEGNRTSVANDDTGNYRKAKIDYLTKKAMK